MPKSFPDLVNEARSAGIEDLSVKHLAALRKANMPMKVLDIRESNELRDDGKVKSAIHVPRGLLEMNIDRLIRNPNELLVLICSDGLRSVLAAESLQRMGYPNARPLLGGLRALRKAAEGKDAD